MDPQLKRGVLEMCVLAYLKKGDSYGYKLIKDISPYIKISESTLYPILKRLETNKLVDIYTNEHNGRLRKYYKITKKGISDIEDFKDEWEAINEIYLKIVKGEEK